MKTKCIYMFCINPLWCWAPNWMPKGQRLNTTTGTTTSWRPQCRAVGGTKGSWVLPSHRIPPRDVSAYPKRKLCHRSCSHWVRYGFQFERLHEVIHEICSWCRLRQRQCFPWLFWMPICMAFLIFLDRSLHFEVMDAVLVHKHSELPPMKWMIGETSHRMLHSNRQTWSNGTTSSLFGLHIPIFLQSHSISDKSKLLVVFDEAIHPQELNRKTSGHYKPPEIHKCQIHLWRLVHKWCLIPNINVRSWWDHQIIRLFTRSINHPSSGSPEVSNGWCFRWRWVLELDSSSRTLSRRAYSATEWRLKKG